MQIVRERPCQRRHHRVSAPMKITIPGGYQSMATDWSIGGSRLDNVDVSTFKIGQQLTLNYELPFQGFDISFDVDVKIVRLVSETDTVAFEHLDLSERANDLMNHFINDLIRGQMGTVEDTICRIDVPVTPISTKPDVNPLEEVPVRRLPIKTILMSAFYIVLGISVFGYLAILLYTNTMRMEVKTAVISKPLLTLKMPMDGMLIPVNLSRDQEVRKGMEIARIVNSKVEQEIEKARSAYEEKKRFKELTEEKFRIESSRMKVYSIVSRTDRQISKAQVDAAAAALEAADTAFARMSQLKAKGLIKSSDYDEALKRREIAQSELKQAEYTLEQNVAVEGISTRRYFNRSVVADLDLLALEVEEKNAELEAAHSQLVQLEQARNNMIIRAPFDGRIVSLNELGNTNVSRDQDILTLEKIEEPTVTAFLTQDEILTVGLNDEASVFLPSSGLKIKAVVTRIDRNSTFLETNKSHYVWNDGKNKSAAVSLKIISKDLPFEIQAGIPAVVLFSKRSTNDIYVKLGDSMRSLAGASDHDTKI